MVPVHPWLGCLCPARCSGLAVGAGSSPPTPTDTGPQHRAALPQGPGEAAPCPDMEWGTARLQTLSVLPPRIAAEKKNKMTVLFDDPRNVIRCEFCYELNAHKSLVMQTMKGLYLCQISIFFVIALSINNGAFKCPFC